MAENYNLNSGFGFNIQKPAVNPNGVKQETQNTENRAGNLIDSVTGYVAKYENVFNGEVEKETNMYIRQLMIVGMGLRAEDSKKHNFDMNI